MDRRLIANDDLSNRDQQSRQHERMRGSDSYPPFEDTLNRRNSVSHRTKGAIMHPSFGTRKSHVNH